MYKAQHYLHNENKYLLDGGAAGPRDTRAALRFLATSAAVSLVALRFCLERFIVVGGYWVVISCY